MQTKKSRVNTCSYELNGPDVKILAEQRITWAEKYLQLARDAQSSGDPVMAENYLQHAEHYFRLIAAAQTAQLQSQQGYVRAAGDPEIEDEEDEDDFGGLPDRFASPAERFQPQTFAPPPPQQPYNQHQQPYQERQPLLRQRAGAAAARPATDARPPGPRPGPPPGSALSRSTRSKSRSPAIATSGRNAWIATISRASIATSSPEFSGKSSPKSSSRASSSHGSSPSVWNSRGSTGSSSPVPCFQPNNLKPTSRQTCRPYQGAVRINGNGTGSAKVAVAKARRKRLARGGSARGEWRSRPVSLASSAADARSLRIRQTAKPLPRARLPASQRVTLRPGIDAPRRSPREWRMSGSRQAIINARG